MIIEDLTGLYREFIEIYALHRRQLRNSWCTCGDSIDYDSHIEEMLQEAAWNHISEWE